MDLLSINNNLVASRITSNVALNVNENTKGEQTGCNPGNPDDLGIHEHISGLSLLAPYQICGLIFNFKEHLVLLAAAEMM